MRKISLIVAIALMLAGVGAWANSTTQARTDVPAGAQINILPFQPDYSRFLAPGVPEAIRNKALRQLWNSSSIFTAADPFQDYQGAFTDAPWPRADPSRMRRRNGRSGHASGTD